MLQNQQKQSTFLRITSLVSVSTLKLAILSQITALLSVKSLHSFFNNAARLLNDFKFVSKYNFGVPHINFKNLDDFRILTTKHILN